MKLIVKTYTEDKLVQAACDKLIPKLNTIEDLGEPTIPYPSRRGWIKDYEADLGNGKIGKIELIIREIKNGISITGSEQIFDKGSKK
jgi:hypothetical protein